ncbi:MAG: sugar ABC transporter ATP-binding protein [Acidimicrobiia bacterium]
MFRSGDHPALRVSGLTKHYGTARVLNGVDIDFFPGEIHALLGENGAGKSTLIKIASGAIQPDSGEMFMAGQEVAFRTPLEATRAGIATVHQELSVAPGLSIAENVFLGQSVSNRFGVMRWAAINKRATQLMSKLGLQADVTADVSSLPPIGQTLTALARALSLESSVLLLDEPTSVFTDAESERLFQALAELKASGVAIIYVSHRLSEVLEVADRYTVLRGGEKVGAGVVSGADTRSLVELMAGRQIEAVFPEKEPIHGDGHTVLSVSDLAGRKTSGLSFEIQAGEVVGIAGLAGSGRSEVLRMVAGTQQAHRGSIMLHGKSFSPRSVRDAQNARVVLVPQERRADGLVPDSVARNLNVTTISSHAYQGIVMSRASENAHATRLAATYNIKYRSLAQDVVTLSGGNQQKVVIAKFLALRPDLVLLDEPTHGVDVATRSEIYRLIRSQSSNGTAFLVVSSEIPELLGLCHRVLVVHHGRVSAEFSGTETTESLILHACYGRTQ